MLEKLPKPPVTRDQLKMLEAGDNVVTNSDAVDTFGLPLVPLDEQLRRGDREGRVTVPFGHVRVLAPTCGRNGHV